MPGYTHLQPAQPVTFWPPFTGLYRDVLTRRDEARFADARVRTNECPLGAAALAGTSFPIDREQTAKALAFKGAMRNSIDAVSDRDFAMEYLVAANTPPYSPCRVWPKKSSFWTSEGFRFVKLSEAFTTGSSIMPQKRNPDAAELVRGNPASSQARMCNFYADEGLPLTYNKDMQESKPPVIKRR